jgi:hypothetical protein
MKLESLKDLKAVMLLCRKQGISSIEVDGVKLVLGDAPAKAPQARSLQTPEPDLTPSTPDESELLFWSVRDQMLDAKADSE